MAFEKYLEWVLAHEGGYVNHPRDPGGETNKGVTKRVYDGYRIRLGLKTRSVRHIEDMEVAEIYRQQYFDVVRGDDLPAGLDYAMFDFAVNSGPRRAIQFLQRILGVDDDGVIGNVTLRAVSQRDTTYLVTKLCDDRLAFLKRLRHWGTFGRGWASRVAGVRERGLALVSEAPPPEAPVSNAGAARSETAELSLVEQVKENFTELGSLTSVAGAASLISSLGDLQAEVLIAAIVAITFLAAIPLVINWRKRAK